MATLIVDRIDDVTAADGQLTLREAVDLASSGDTIKFASPGTITLPHGVIHISAVTLTIDGNVISPDNKADVTISAAGAAGGIFEVARGGSTLNLSSLTRSGTTGQSAVYVNGNATLNVEYSTFANNSDPGHGGVIDIAGQPDHRQHVHGEYDRSWRRGTL